jgi:Zn-dependent protease with chaperone function
MMATTHAFVGLALASAYAAVGGEYATVAAVAALVGGVFPDLDLVAEHRKTLHLPEYYAVLAGVAVLAVGVATLPVTVAVAAFLVSAAVHAASDVFGGGTEARPWLNESERAVFLHTQGRWAAPRRYIRYDGAPEDFAVGVAFALPGLVVFDGVIREAVFAGVAVSAVYVVVRKRLPALEERFLE